jgi:hypothetical protein
VKSAKASGCFLSSGFRLQPVSRSVLASFHSQPVEQRALDLLLAGGGFEWAPDETG